MLSITWYEMDISKGMMAAKLQACDEYTVFKLQRATVAVSSPHWMACVTLLIDRHI